MNIKRYNLSKPEEITGRDGSKKTIWHNVGTLTRFIKDDGKVSETVDIPALGLKAQVFEIVEKTPSQNQPRPFYGQTTGVIPGAEPQTITGDLGKVDYPTEEINPEDIPF
ncbi:MAG: hypothetical protein JWM14_2785 [Chitinophagaceae bacterium]|nr:hypothetical protein [Chitinophagaceae bacterium]